MSYFTVSTRAAFVAALFLATPVEAQILPRTMRVPCSGPEVLPDLLIRDYEEAVSGQGVAGGALVQLWRNPETGTWTILLIRPDGLACALSSGEDWMDMSAPPPPEGL